MAGKKERLLSELNKHLMPEQRRLLQLIEIESRKDKLVFRMPSGVIALDSVWDKIVEVASGMKIAYSRTEPFATLEELDDILGDIKWIWPSWLPRGFVTMLVGDPGVGKSMVALDFARIITCGKPSHWPMTDICPPKSNVVWLDTEASQQLLNIRSKQLKMERQRVYIPVISGDILGQPNIGDEDHRETIINLVEAVKPSLIVLDSLGGSHQHGENKIEEMRPVMEFFALLARDYEAAVIVVHHLNKGSPGINTELDLYRVRGSTVITALARTILAVERVKNDTVRLRMIKSNLTRMPEPIGVETVNSESGDITGMKYDVYKPPAKKQTKKESCAAWITTTLQSSPDGIQLKDLVEIGEGYGYTRGNVYSAKDVLGDRVEITGNGREAIWHLSDNLDNDSMNQIINARKSN